VTASYYQETKIHTEYYFVTSSTTVFDLTYNPIDLTQVRLRPESSVEMVNSQSLTITGGDTSVMDITPDFRLISPNQIEISGSGLSGYLYGDNELYIISYPYLI